MSARVRISESSLLLPPFFKHKIAQPTPHRLCLHPRPSYAASVSFCSRLSAQQRMLASS